MNDIERIEITNSDNVYIGFVKFKRMLSWEAYSLDADKWENFPTSAQAVSWLEKAYQQGSVR